MHTKSLFGLTINIPGNDLPMNFMLYLLSEIYNEFRIFSLLELQI